MTGHLAEQDAINIVATQLSALRRLHPTESAPHRLSQPEWRAEYPDNHIR
jgi:hypothetical protein